MNRFATTLSTGTVLAAACFFLFAGSAAADEVGPAPQPSSQPSNEATFAPKPAEPKPQPTDVAPAPQEDPGDPAPKPTKGPDDITDPEPEPTAPGDLTAGDPTPDDQGDKDGPNQGHGPDGPDDLADDAGCQLTHGCPDDGSGDGSGDDSSSVGGTRGQSVSGGLPFTGDNTATLALLGASLLGTGGAALIVARRRTR